MADHPEVDLDVIPTWGLASASANGARVGPRSDIRKCVNQYHKNLRATARNEQEILSESLKVHENVAKAAGMHNELFEENDDDGITLFIPKDGAYAKIDDDKIKALMSSKVKKKNKTIPIPLLTLS